MKVGAFLIFMMLIIITPTLAAKEFGTLFFSPEERTSNHSQVPILIGRVITGASYVDNHWTVWLGDLPIHIGERYSNWTLISANARQSIWRNAAGKSISLKIGQRFPSESIDRDGVGR